jgi:hypothetical protein
VTSVISRDDIEDELVRAGIRSAVIRQHLMRMIEAYARKYPAPEAMDPFVPPDRRDDYTYKCPDCKLRKHIDGFPEGKRLSRRSPIPCLECQGK